MEQSPSVADGYTVDYRISDADRNIHSAWDNSLDPVLTVESGDVVRFECRDVHESEALVSQPERFAFW